MWLNCMPQLVSGMWAACRDAPTEAQEIELVAEGTGDPTDASGSDASSAASESSSGGSDGEDADMDEGSLLEGDLDDVDEDDLDQYRMLMSALRDGGMPDEDLLLDADVASDGSDTE